ncbi:beta-1,3-galactosyltransferase 5-like [Rhinophrynus dorsalis]
MSPKLMADKSASFKSQVQLAQEMIRRRRSTILLFALSIALTLSFFSWIRWEENLLLELPDLSDPIPANLSSPPSLRRSTTLFDSNFSFHLNLSEYSKEYPALQNYRCRAVVGLLGYCRTHDILILLAVKSHPHSFERRKVLRRTWAKERMVQGYKLRSVFLVANSGQHMEMEKAMAEATYFGDMILWDFLESHHNLSLKERCFLEWVNRRCPEAKYIFKGDDDEFVNPYALTSYISSTLPSFPFQIHGQMHLHPPPERWGKYAVPLSVHPHPFYPSFVSGGGFVIPGQVVPALHKAASTIPVFPLDDVFFGFLALAANISFHHEPRFRTFGLMTSHICGYRDVIMVHGLSLQRMIQLWEVLPYTLPCPPGKAEIKDMRPGQ